MSNLLFLLAALVVAALGTGLLVMRSRTPQGVHHGIERFRREMDALAAGRPAPRRPTGQGPVRPVRSARPAQRRTDPPGPGG